MRNVAQTFFIFLGLVGGGYAGRVLTADVMKDVMEAPRAHDESTLLMFVGLPLGAMIGAVVGLWVSGIFGFSK